MSVAAASPRPLAAEYYAIGLALLGAALPLSLVAVEILCGALLCIIFLRSIRGESIPFSIWDAPFLAFILIRSLSGLLSPHAASLSKGLVNLTFCGAYLIAAWDADHRRRQSWEQLVRWLVVGAALVSSYGLWQQISGAQRATGFYGGWTVFGSVTGIALVLGVYTAIAERLFKHKILNAALLLLCAMGLAVSECRVEWLAAALALLPAGLLYHRRLAALAMVAVAAAFMLAAPLRERILRLSDPLQDLIDRGTIWTPALDLISQAPFLGHGLNSFRDVFPESLRHSMFDPGAGDWHNVYLQVAVESGLLGLAAFLLLLGGALYAAYVGIRNAPNRNEQALAWGLFCGLSFFAIAGGLGTFLVRITVTVMVFMMMGRMLHLHDSPLRKP
jgi:O-antigen ligase